jgi:hypothetical protein
VVEEVEETEFYFKKSKKLEIFSITGHEMIDPDRIPSDD